LAADVLISGISGFIGSNLTRYLLNHSEMNIAGCSRNLDKIKQLGESIHSVYSNDDIFSIKPSFKSYVHLSGKVYDMHDKKDEGEYFDANFNLTKKFFQNFIDDKASKNFIFLSTIHVLTENPEKELDETYEPKPFTPYGKSKFKAENYIRKHCPPDKNYYILRPSMIHGPGNKGNLNLLYNLVKYGIPYPVGAYNNKRSFVSIENLCFIIQEIIENSIPKGLYHISDDEPTYTHDLVKMIADATNRKGRIWKIPPAILNILAKIGNHVPFVLNEHRLKKLTGDFIVSNEKIKKAIGKPLPVRASEGLEITLNSLRNN
jgi:nucleoside-diphosphate-sugar epimerase